MGKVRRRCQWITLWHGYRVVYNKSDFQWAVTVRFSIGMAVIVLPFCVGDEYDMTKRFLVLFGLIISAGAVSADPLLDGDAEAGQQKAAVCAACHGPKGNMESAQFPKLAGQGAPYIYEQLMLFKSGERENAIMMGQASGLSEQEMKDLAVYFSAQQTKPGVADEAVAPAGAAIYHGGNPDKNIPACAGCHGPAGVGNAAAKFPRLSGQNPQYIAAQLTAYRDGTRSGYRNATIMNGVAERLSDADIKALASYVSGLAPTDGKTRSDQYGALMQGAGGPDAASNAPADDGASEQPSESDGGQQPEKAMAGGNDAAAAKDAQGDSAEQQPDAADGSAEAGQAQDQSDQADAAAKQEADAAAGSADPGADDAQDKAATDTDASADDSGDASQ